MMSDQKLSELPETTSLEAGDLLYVARSDGSGGHVSRRLDAANLRTGGGFLVVTGRLGPLAPGSGLNTRPAIGVDFFTLADVTVEGVQAWLHAESDFPIELRLIVAEVDGAEDSEILDIRATTAYASVSAAGIITFDGLDLALQRDRIHAFILDAASGELTVTAEDRAGGMPPLVNPFGLAGALGFSAPRDIQIGQSVNRYNSSMPHMRIEGRLG